MSKTDQAYEHLRQDILRGALRPDEPLIVAQLMEAYGFGWTPLRDALSRLEGEGLVTLQRNRGYRVAGVSFQELRELQEARLLIEAALLREAIALGDEDWAKRLLLAHHHLSRAPEPERGMLAADYNRWEAAHQEFHLALLSGAANAWLKDCIAKIYAQVQRHQRAFVVLDGQSSDSLSSDALGNMLSGYTGLGHHTRLMQAALDRRQDEALILLREHLGTATPPPA